MPHLPDRHADHDHALVSASATEDLKDAERIAVTRLLAACPECAALRSDLRAIALATADLPVPPRRRDYRITAEQAARLRPRGLGGILATLASRRFSFAAPVGTAMATLGVVGLLLAALPGPLAGGAAPAPGADLAAPAPAEPAPAPVTEPAVGGAQLSEPITTAASGGAPAGSELQQESATRLQQPASTTERQATGDDAVGGDAGTSGDVAGAVGVDADTGPTPLTLLSLLAVLVGLALVLLRLVARRTVA